MKEKVSFEVNQPVEVCLANPVGQDVAGRLGNEAMFPLIDGRVMLVPTSVRDHITRLGIKMGEAFNICKREVNDRGEPMVEWVVGRNGDHPPLKALENVRRRLEAAGLVLTVSNRLPNNTGDQLCFASGDVVNVFDSGKVTVQGKAESRVRELLGLEPVAGPDSPRPGGKLTNPATVNEVEHTKKPESLGKNGQPKLSTVMQMALQGALDATRAVEKYAEEGGINDRNGDPFRFSNSDIRAIGLTLFIEARRRSW
jgi:hypothetical protein